MLRPLLALSAAALAAAPAAAATYSATPAAPAESSRVAARDILWTCGPQSCVGSTRNSRPLVLCQGLAKKVGRLDSFAVDGQAIAAAELDRCNASAKAGKAAGLATAG